MLCQMEMEQGSVSPNSLGLCSLTVPTLSDFCPHTLVVQSQLG